MLPLPTLIGGLFSARNWRRTINLLRRVRYIRGGPKIAVTQGKSGVLISHAKDSFYAQVCNNLFDIYHDESGGATTATVEVTATTIILIVDAATQTITFDAEVIDGEGIVTTPWNTIGELVDYINGLGLGWVATLQCPVNAPSNVAAILSQADAFGVANEQEIVVIYGDERYVVGEQYISNTSTTTTEAVTFTDKTNGLTVVATNTAEILTGIDEIHGIGDGEYVKVYIVRDAQTNKVTRYVFNRAS